MKDLTPRFCDALDCTNLSHSRGKYCAGHAKRLQRGTESDEPLRRQHGSLRERVEDLIIDFADSPAEDDEERDSRWDTLRKAVIDWADEERGRRGGRARAKALTPKQRIESARRAALALAAAMTPEQRRARARQAADARAASMTEEQRQESARRAALARWANKRAGARLRKHAQRKRSTKAAAA